VSQEASLVQEVVYMLQDLAAKEGEPTSKVRKHIKTLDVRMETD
jgi:hypothetical protein